MVFDGKEVDDDATVESHKVEDGEQLTEYG